MVLTKSDLLQIKEILKIDELNKSILALSTTFTSSVTNLESSITTSVSFLEESINDKLSILETEVDANIQSLEANFRAEIQALSNCHQVFTLQAQNDKIKYDEELNQLKGKSFEYEINIAALDDELQASNSHIETLSNKIINLENSVQ